jgi:hypothetical protein
MTSDAFLDPRGAWRAWGALALLVPVPTIAILMNMVFFPGPLGMASWTVSKVWILAFPLVWTRFVEGAPLRFPAWSRAGLAQGLAFGLLAAAGVLLCDRLLLRALLEPSAFAEMIGENGLDRPWAYAGMAVYICVVNSLLEEYVWRWFVFRQIQRLVSPVLAVLLSAAAFTLHHTVIVQTQFGDWGLTALASVGVFIGGAMWSALYLRFRSIWPAWLSHVVVDVAVFVIGARLVFGVEWI